MKIAYFGNGLHSVDYKRHKLFAEKNGYREVSQLRLTDELSRSQKNDLLFSDNCDIKTLLVILLLQLTGRVDRITLILLELYSISYAAIYEELRFQLSRKITASSLKTILYSLLVVPIRIKILRFIFNAGFRTLIVPSDLRIDYLKNILSDNVSYILLRNKPILADLKIDKHITYEKLDKRARDVIEQGRYLLIAGRINVETEFYKICKYAQEKNLTIIVATGQKDLLKRSLDNYPEVILNLGTICNELVMYLSSNCIAGICLYHNNTVNQRYSASSKLFEFMLINKPIIASLNPGVLGDIDDDYRHMVIFVENLDIHTKILNVEMKYNKKYSFEYELDNIVMLT